MAHRSHEFAESIAYNENLTMGIGMLNRWLTEWHSYDLETYDILSYEEEYSVELPGPFPQNLTGRTDAVIQRRDNGQILVREYKTTTYSVKQMYRSVNLQDQSTSYLWALKKTHPEWNVMGIQPDILYNRGRNFLAARPGVIYRSERELLEFESGMGTLMYEISQKVKALETHPHYALFPRNGDSCSKYGCPFEEICRVDIQPDEEPLGFRKEG
jgi:hypothetical protein